MKRILLTGVAMVALPAAALAECPGITVADMQGVMADFCFRKWTFVSPWVISSEGGV